MGMDRDLQRRELDKEVRIFVSTEILRLLSPKRLKAIRPSYLYSPPTVFKTQNLLWVSCPNHLTRLMFVVSLLVFGLLLIAFTCIPFSRPVPFQVEFAPESLLVASIRRRVKGVRRTATKSAELIL